MQAIDRTHRLGQFKPIYATRFIIEDTVEERIIKLQVPAQAPEIISSIVTYDVAKPCARSLVNLLSLPMFAFKSMGKKGGR